MKLTRMGLLLASSVCFCVSLWGHLVYGEAKKYAESEATLLYGFSQTTSSARTGGAEQFRDTSVKLKYEYSVDGQNYTGNKLQILGAIYHSAEKLDEVTAGRNIVFYYPSNPRKSYLYIDYPVEAIALLVFAGMFTALLSVFLPNLIRYFLPHTGRNPHKA
jgi:hypothetical protein